jgi:predicted Zn finger-like uncharacterized protein
MKTRCPNCQTAFRVTPEQLKARVGKVRCGQCQSVFNALDSLLDEIPAPAPRSTQIQPPAPAAPPPAVSGRTVDDIAAHPAMAPTAHATTFLFEPDADEPPNDSHDADAPPLSEAYAQELGKATGLIMPRETTDIPGYSKWVEGVMSGPLSLPSEKASRWPFVLAALLLALALAGQLVFRFRSEIATTAPSLRPALEVFCQALNADIPLPRHVELVSIETSDLQTDPARGNLLVLNATLRNRASYGQAYPSLELSLTDTHDAAIARRVFAPGEYLPAKTPADQPFAAKSDITVRLWIEATEISAAGYRLYVFYP